jgi:hypothetical protein
MARYQQGINPDCQSIEKGLLGYPSPAHASFRKLCPGYADMDFMAKRDMARPVIYGTPERER